MSTPENRKENRFSAWLNGTNDTLLDRSLLESQLRPADEEVYPQPPEHLTQDEEDAKEAEEIARRLEDWNSRKVPQAAYRAYCVLGVLMCVVMIGLMLYVVTTLPSFGRAEHPINNEVSQRYIENGLQETGAVNIVTGMILDYRAFDTLGESTVLFTAAMVVLLLLRMDKDSDRYSALASAMRQSRQGDTIYEPKHDAILQYTARILSPIVVLFGVYVVLNGHLSPGGGFSGGAIMGAGLVLHVTAFGFDDIRRFFSYKIYQRIVLVALMTYAVSKCYSFYTGANGLHSVIPLGTPGAILSSGLILVLNICVGCIVTCTMFVFYAMFRKGEL